MQRLIGKTVLITGASAGIGEACAREFARHGSHLILTARRLDRLESIKASIQTTHNVNVHCAQVDVTNEAQVKEAIRSLPDIDILVNNAGMVVGMDKVENIPLDVVDTMFNTNVKGVLHFIQAVLPRMRERNSGHVINIGSVAGIQAYAHGGVYCATKHALDALTKALRFETIDTAIRISEIKPGMVQTEFSVVRFKGDVDRAAQVYQGMEPLTPQDIAETVVFVASRPPHVNIADMLVFPTSQAAATTVHRQ